MTSDRAPCGRQHADDRAEPDGAAREDREAHRDRCERESIAVRIPQPQQQEQRTAHEQAERDPVLLYIEPPRGPRGALDQILVKVGKRLYDPAIGRFLSRDPLFIPRTSVTTNPYAFAMNDPVNLSDPSGLDPCAAQPLCISSSLNGESSSALATAATLGILAADFLIGGGSEPPMANMSGPQIAAYSAAFDGQLAQHRLSVATSQVMGAGDSGNWASNLVGGVGDGFYDLGAGLVHSALHPVQTVRGLGHALAHPIQTGRAIGRSVSDTTRSILAGDTRALGHALVGVVAIVGPGAAEKALGQLAEATEVASVVAPGKAFEGFAKATEVASVVEEGQPLVNLASEKRTIHILNGDATGGGHMWPGNPGKTPFPRECRETRSCITYQTSLPIPPSPGPNKVVEAVRCSHEGALPQDFMSSVNVQESE